MIIILVSAMLALVLIRVSLKPVTVADVAGAYAQTAVGGSVLRLPLELSESEDFAFKMPWNGGNKDFEFRIGADLCPELSKHYSWY